MATGRNQSKNNAHAAATSLNNINLRQPTETGNSTLEIMVWLQRNQITAAANNKIKIKQIKTLTHIIKLDSQAAQTYVKLLEADAIPVNTARDSIQRSIEKLLNSKMVNDRSKGESSAQEYPTYKIRLDMLNDTRNHLAQQYEQIKNAIAEAQRLMAAQLLGTADSKEKLTTLSTTLKNQIKQFVEAAEQYNYQRKEIYKDLQNFDLRINPAPITQHARPAPQANL